jgi:hypothetical protein
MDTIRKPYQVPSVAVEGTIESLTRVVMPPPFTDTSHTGKRDADGSVGFML